MNEDRDRAEDQAGVAQIEVTPEMIDAGVDVYVEWCPDTGVGDAVDRKMIIEIFSEMERTRRMGVALLAA